MSLLSKYKWASLMAQLVDSACNAGDLGLILGLRRSPREGKGYSLQYSGLENSMDYTVHGVTKSRTRLSDFTFTFHFPALEKAMATHSSFLAWRIPGTGEPHGLPSMGSHRVGRDWSDLAAVAAAWFLLISISMKYLFPFPHFQSVCIPRSDVGLL